MRKDAKIKIYKTMVMPVLIYGKIEFPHEGIG